MNDNLVNGRFLEEKRAPQKLRLIAWQDRLESVGVLLQPDQFLLKRRRNLCALAFYQKEAFYQLILRVVEDCPASVNKVNIVRNLFQIA